MHCMLLKVCKLYKHIIGNNRVFENNFGIGEKKSARRYNREIFEHNRLKPICHNLRAWCIHVLYVTA